MNNLVYFRGILAGAVNPELYTIIFNLCLNSAKTYSYYQYLGLTIPHRPQDLTKDPLTEMPSLHSHVYSQYQSAINYMHI